MSIIICPKCLTEFDNYSSKSPERPLKFCSPKCANGRVQTEIQNELRRKKLKGRSSCKFFTVEQRRIFGDKISKAKTTKLLLADFDSLRIESKKKRVLLEQNRACLICGISSWQEKPLKLAVDHKDGNTNNNTRDNLRGLCPNCHSQTETFCGRNVKKQVSDPELISALIKFKSIGSALESLGKGRNKHNYQRCFTLITKHKIEFH